MVAPLTYLPIYLQLLSMSRKNCQSVPASDVALTTVCNDLLSGVTTFKTALDTVNSILPTRAQMAELQDVAWTFPTTNQTSQASKKVIKLLLDMNESHPGELSGDKAPGNLFSEERLEELQKDLTKQTLPELSDFDQTEMIMQVLLQTRMMRIEGNRFHKWSQIMLVVIICPQLLILVFISIQFALLKRREHRMRKNTMRMSRERSMMQSLLAEMRGQHHSEERPAAVVAHL